MDFAPSRTVEVIKLDHVDEFIHRIDQERKVNGALKALSTLCVLFASLKDSLSDEQLNNIILEQLCQIDKWGRRLHSVSGKVLLELAENEKTFTDEQDIAQVKRLIKNLADDYHSVTRSLVDEFGLGLPQLLPSQERLWNRVGASIDLARQDSSIVAELLNIAVWLHPEEVVPHLQLTRENILPTWRKFRRESHWGGHLFENGMVAYIVRNEECDFAIEALHEIYREYIPHGMLIDGLFNQKLVDSGLLDKLVHQIRDFRTSSRSSWYLIRQLTMSTGFGGKNLDQWKEASRVIFPPSAFENVFDTMRSELKTLLETFDVHPELRKAMNIREVINALLDSTTLVTGGSPSIVEMVAFVTCLCGSELSYEEYQEWLKRLNQKDIDSNNVATDCMTRMMQSTNAAQTQLELTEKYLPEWSKQDWFPCEAIISLMDSPYDQFAKIILRVSMRNLELFWPFMRHPAGIELFRKFVATPERVNSEDDKGRTPLWFLLACPSTKKSWKRCVWSLINNPQLDKSFIDRKGFSYVDHALRVTRNDHTTAALYDTIKQMFKQGFACKQDPIKAVEAYANRQSHANLIDVSCTRLLLRYTTLQLTRDLEELLKSSKQNGYSQRILCDYLLWVRFWTTIMSVKGRVGRNSPLKFIPSDVLRRMKCFLDNCA